MALTGDGVQDGEELLHELRQEGPLQLRPACVKGRGSVRGWSRVMEGWGSDGGVGQSDGGVGEYDGGVREYDGGGGCCCVQCHGRVLYLSLLSTSILLSFFWRWFQYFLSRGCFLNSSSRRPWTAAQPQVSTPQCTPLLTVLPLQYSFPFLTGNRQAHAARETNFCTWLRITSSSCTRTATHGQWAEQQPHTREALKLNPYKHSIV